MTAERYEIMGCPCIAMTESDAIALILEMIEEKKTGYTVAINAEKIERYRMDSEFESIIDNSLLPYPDGAGAVLGLKWLHGLSAEKVNMPVKALEAANQVGLRTFIIGATEFVHDRAIENIIASYEHINLVGHMHGFHPRESMIEELIKVKPQLILISMGSPLQEIIAAELISRSDFGLVIGCGGALDILAGAAVRAPKFMIVNNLEWLYRLVKQPRRLRRQLFLPVFLLRLIFQALCLKL